MKRIREDMGPAAAALRRRKVFQDRRASNSQITAEQLIAEAQDLQRMTGPKQDSTRIVINSAEEQALHRQRMRADLEVRVTRGYAFLGNWLKYGLWESHQKDFVRMRSVLERAMKTHSSDPVLWRSYAELEMSNGFVQHARAVWDRAVTALPYCEELWMGCLVMEQAAMNDGNVRDIFNRWMQQKPSICAWKLFVAYEASRGRVDSCRDILRRLVEAENSVVAWLFYGEMEQAVFNNPGRAISVYETAIQALLPEQTNGVVDHRVSVALAQAYISQGETARARSVFCSLLQTTQDPVALDQLLGIYTRFERLNGAGGVEEERLARRQAKVLYEQRVKRNEMDFDAWLLHYVIQRHEIAEEAERMGRVTRPGARPLVQPAPVPPPSDEAYSEMCTATGGVSTSLVVRDARGAGGALTVPAVSAYERKRREAAEWLAAAIRVQCAGPLRCLASQQQAVLAMEAARLAEEISDVATARTAFASIIKRFPCESAACPKLWVEAAALEERHSNVDQGRKLLSAGMNVSGELAVFEAALAFETRQSKTEDYAPRCRKLFEAAIQKYPLEDSLWCFYAKFEAEQLQRQRSDALFDLCIKRLTAAALEGQSSAGGRSGSRTLSLSEKYQLFERVDLVWSRRIAQMKRSTRRMAPTEGGALVLNLYKALVQSIWSCFTQEFGSWRAAYVRERHREREELEQQNARLQGRGRRHNETGNQSSAEAKSGKAPTAAGSSAAAPPAAEVVAADGIPKSIPPVLSPALLRWSEALQAAVSYLLQVPAAVLSTAASTPIPSAAAPAPGQMTAQETSARIAPMRTWLHELIREERNKVIAEAAESSEENYKEVKEGKQWTELLLSPLFDEWRQIETAYGTPKTLSSISSIVQQTQARRTRLFGKK